jgi:DNA-binding MarR family transcriptional regulator
MRFIADEESTPERINVDLVRTGYDGDLNGEERFLIMYFAEKENGERIGTEEIADQTGWSKSKVRRIMRSLEEKGYLYRDENNWDRQTGPEIIVAERKGLLPNDDQEE